MKDEGVGANLQPGPMAVACPTCDEPVVCQPHGYTLYYEPSEGPPERWTLLQCPQDHTLLVLQNQYSGMRFEDDVPYLIYPPQERPLSREIPETLREAHEEARRCCRAKAWIGTVAMCGRTLEGACELNEVTGKTLQDRLKGMKDRGLIDGRLWEWAETLRGVRNAASHFNAEAVTQQDAEDALAFNEALLDYLYVLTARFEAMKARRSPT